MMTENEKIELKAAIEADPTKYFYCPACDAVSLWDDEKECFLLQCYYSELPWEIELQSTTCGCND